MADWVQKMKDTMQPAGSRKDCRATPSANVKMAMLALTADKLYAFSGTPKGTNWKVGDRLGSWNRNDLKITTERGKVATKVTMDVVSTGDRYELEATTALQRSGFTDAFLAELTKR